MNWFVIHVTEHNQVNKIRGGIMKVDISHYMCVGFYVIFLIIITASSHVPAKKYHYLRGTYL